MEDHRDVIDQYSFIYILDFYYFKCKPDLEMEDKTGNRYRDVFFQLFLLSEANVAMKPRRNKFQW